MFPLQIARRLRMFLSPSQLLSPEQLFGQIEKRIAAEQEAARIADEIKIDNSYFTTNKSLSIQLPPSIVNPSESFISCDAFLGDEKELCLVSSKHAREYVGKKSGRSNFLEYLRDIIPNQGRKIGLVTFQNGIMNTPEDFELMGKLILGHFPENPLCIGLYNKKLGLLKHLKRVPFHIKNDMTKVVGRTYIFFKSLIKLIHSINPNLIWIHVMHSEGGAIGSRALGAMSGSEIHFFRRSLITIAYGPLLPIPREYALRTFNSYSSKDRTTGLFGLYFENQPDYDIVFKSVKTPIWKNALETTGMTGTVIANLPPGDHDFRGKTYQALLEDNVKDIKKMLLKGQL